MSDYDKLMAGLRACAENELSCAGCTYCSDNAKCIADLISDAAAALEQQRADINRLTAENRAKEQYIAEHMGGTAERNARMRRDAERLRGTGTHAFADGGALILKDEYT